MRNLSWGPSPQNDKLRWALRIMHPLASPLVPAACLAVGIHDCRLSRGGCVSQHPNLHIINALFIINSPGKAFLKTGDPHRHPQISVPNLCILFPQYILRQRWGGSSSRATVLMEPTLVATTADHSLTVCCSYVEERNEDAPANASCFQSPHAPDRDGRQWKTSSLRKVTTSLSRLQVAEAQRHGTCTTRRMTDSDFGHAVGELLEMKMFLYVTPWTVCVLCTCREEVVFTRWLCIYTCMSLKKQIVYFD
jgi:hypothetical protein